MKAKPDINAFLEGGAGDLADIATKPKKDVLVDVQPVANAKVHREQKVFRLPIDLINDLKREAFEQSMKTGGRVTETELVEKALRNFLDRNITI